MKTLSARPQRRLERLVAAWMFGAALTYASRGAAQTPGAPAQDPTPPTPPTAPALQPSAASAPPPPPTQAPLDSPASVPSAPPTEGAGPVPSAAPEPTPPPPAAAPQDTAPPRSYVTPPPPPSKDDEPEGRHGLYARLFAEVIAHGHYADYQLEDVNRELDQTLAGAGYGLGFMLGGSPRENFAIGGAVVFEHVVVSHVEIDDEDSPSSDESMWSLSVGPSVDYFPSKYFHVGGTLGLAVARVPDLDRTSGHDTAFGTSGEIWAGFDFPLSEDLAMGIIFTGRYISLGRDLGDDDVDEEESREGGISGGIGATLLAF